MADFAPNLFSQFAVILMAAAAIGLVGLALRQPLIVSYIVVGIAFGWYGAESHDAATALGLLSDFGVVALLFMVGLKLEIGLIRSLGPVAITTGLGQIVFTWLVSFAACAALGLDVPTSAFIALALTFSSTIIVVKLLSDRRELETLHGRIALGILIVQDIVLIAAIAVMAASSVGRGTGEAHLSAAQVIAGSLVFVAAVAVFMRYAAERVLARLMTSPELLVSFAIGWAASLAAVAEYIGLGKELGGLIAGVSFASTPFREAIASRLASLRDFLLVFFFIGLGMSLDFANVGAQILPAIILSVFVLIGHPWVVIAIMGAMGYRRRTSFMTALSIAQISEFSLIFAAMAHSLGYVDESAVALVTIVAMITIAASTHLITYAHKLYPLFERILGLFERKAPHRHARFDNGSPKSYDFVVLGFGRFGNALASKLVGGGASVLGVDFDPHALEEWRAKGHDLQFGDIFDPDLPSQLPLDGVRWIVCTVPFHQTGLTHQDPRHTLIDALKQHAFSGRVAVIAFSDREADALRRAGADLVLRPFVDAAARAAEILTNDGSR